MGPISGKLAAELRREEDAAIREEQRKRVQLFNEERRKEEAHKQKMAIERAKTTASGVPLPAEAPPRSATASAPLSSGSMLDKAARVLRGEATARRLREAEQGLSDGTTAVGPLSRRNPSDVIPARLTPGEAVIPAPAAQLPENKPVIAGMVNQGRQLNALSQMLSPVWAALVAAATGNSGMVGQTKNNLHARKAKLEDAERRALGYSEGTTGAGTFQQETPLLNKLFDGTALGEWLKDYQQQVATDKAAVTQQVATENAKASQPGPADAAAPPALPHGSPARSSPLGVGPGAVPNSVSQSSTAVAPSAVQVVQWHPAPLGTKKTPPAPDVGYPTPETATVRDAMREAPSGVSMLATDIVEDKMPGQGFRATRASAQLETKLGETLKDPGIRAQLLKLEATPPPEGTDQKDWLAKGLSGIFGPTGLFSPDELIRFGIVAAGGMLTGASISRSIRWAGVDALRQSTQRLANQEAAKSRAQERALNIRDEAARDAREVEQEQNRYERDVAERAVAARKAAEIAQGVRRDAAIAEASKDVRERYQTIEGNVRVELEGRPRPLQEKAIMMMQTGEQLFQEGKHDQAVQIMRATHAMLMAGKPDKKKGGDGGEGDDGQPRLVKVNSRGYLRNGEVITYAVDNKGNPYRYDDAIGRHVRIAEMPLDQEVVKGFKKDLKEQTATRIAPMLAARNTSKGYNAEADANRIGTDVSELVYEYMYSGEPGKAARVAEQAIQNLQAGGFKDTSPEGLRRVITGMVLVANSPSNDVLYYSKGEDGKQKPPAPLDLAILSGVVSSRMKAEGASNPAVIEEKLKKEFIEHMKDPRKASKVELLAKGYGSSKFLAFIKARQNGTL